MVKGFNHSAEVWEGKAPAETVANGDWRMANSERRMVFLEAVLLHCRKIFGTSGDVPSSFSACFNRLRFRSHQLQLVDDGRVRLTPNQNGCSREGDER